MEELHQRLRTLEKMIHELDYICGLVYVLKDAVWQNEQDLTSHYSMAAFYISEKLNDFDDRLANLLEDLFDSYRNLPKTV